MYSVNIQIRIYDEQHCNPVEYVKRDAQFYIECGERNTAALAQALYEGAHNAAAYAADELKCDWSNEC